MLALGEEGEGVACLEADGFVWDEGDAGSGDFYYDCVGGEREVGDGFSGEGGFGAYGEFHEVPFFFFWYGTAGAELFLEEGFVDGGGAEEAAGDVGDGGGEGERHEVGEAAGHFEKEDGAGDGGADASGEEGGHGDADHVGHVDGRKEAHADEDASRAGSGEGADDKGGEEESARRAAPKAHEGEEYFSCKEQRQHGERWIARDDGVHNAVPAAKDLREEKSEDARQCEGKGNFAEPCFEEGKPIEPVHVEESVVEWDGRGACNDGEKHDVGEVRRGKRLDLGKEENGAFSEEETDESGCGDGSGHGREEDSGREALLHFFQYEEHAGEGRVENSRETRTGTAGKEEMLFETATAGEAGYALGSSCTNLDSGPSMAERHARTDGKCAAADLYDENPEPVHAHEAAENAFHLGDAASRRHRFPAAKPCEDPREKGKREEPEEGRQEMVAEERRGEDFFI